MTALSAGKLWGLRRLAGTSRRFSMVAVDQRPPIKNLIRERRKLGTAEPDYADVCAVKRALIAALAPHASALLLDPHGAYPAGIDLLSPAQGLIMTLEDSLFTDTPDGRLSREIDAWSVAKIKRAGGDAVKLLAWYRPDAGADVCRHQQDFIKRVGDACAHYDLPFVLELLLYPLSGEQGQTTDYIEQPGKRAEHVLESVAAFAGDDYGVDLFKLESPLAAATLPDPLQADPAEVRAAQEAFNTLGRLADRPWVMLSAGAAPEAFERVLGYAYRAGASGYLAGRAIWWQAFQAFPDMARFSAELQDAGVAYMQRLNQLTEQHATPWDEHPRYGSDGPTLAARGEQFRQQYGDFGETDG